MKGAASGVARACVSDERFTFSLAMTLPFLSFRWSALWLTMVLLAWGGPHARANRIGRASGNPRNLVYGRAGGQDLKLDLDRLTQEEAVAAARYLAGVVGKAHGRQMDQKTRTSWLTKLKKQHSRSLDAPGWLWSSVVSLIADHEAAYLEHCRRYAGST